MELIHAASRTARVAVAVVAAPLAFGCGSEPATEPSAGSSASTGRDYDDIAPLGMPILLLSKIGSNHGGDLMSGQGDFAKINLAWLNWWLKDDLTETGKGALVGATCKYCSDSTWEVKSMNIP